MKLIKVVNKYNYNNNEKFSPRKKQIIHRGSQNKSSKIYEKTLS